MEATTHTLRRLVTIVASIAASACAPTEVRAPAAGADADATREPGVHAGTPTATFRVQNHLAWPFRLARLVLIADGQVVRSQVFPRGAAPSSVSMSIPVAPGDHVLQVLAEAQVSMTAGGPECAAKLKSSTPYVADTGSPAEIDADLYLRPPPRPFAQQLDVKIDVRGRSRDAWLAQRVPAADEARCRPLRAPDRAMCRVEAMVAEATRQRDVIKLICNRDKLDQMRVLARLRDEAASLLRAAPLEIAKDGPRRSPPIFWTELPAEITSGNPPIDQAEVRDRVLVLDKTIEGLGREADQCVGEEPIFFGGPMVTVDEACFEKALPQVDLDPFDGPPRSPWAR